MTNDRGKTPAGWATIESALQEMAKRSHTTIEVEIVGGRLEASTRETTPDGLKAAIGAAIHLAAETCETCGRAGTRHQGPGDGQCTSCRNCRKTGSVAVEREWTAPETELMTEEEIAADGWGPMPESRGRMRCCRWTVEHVEEVMNAVHEEDDERGWCFGAWSGGWNHLARALVGWALEESAAGRPTAFNDLKEKWGQLSAIQQPLTDRSHGGYLLIAIVSRTTCEECGRPGRLRDRMKAFGGMTVACDRCETEWRATKAGPQGTVRKQLEARRRHQGWPDDIDAEIERGLAELKALETKTNRGAGGDRR